MSSIQGYNYDSKNLSGVYNLNQYDDQIITQEGDGTNIMKSTNIIGDLYISGNLTSLVDPSYDSYASVVYVDAQDTTLQDQITTLKTKTALMTTTTTVTTFTTLWATLNTVFGSGASLVRCRNNCNVENCLRIGYADSLNVVYNSSLGGVLNSTTSGAKLDRF